MNEQLLIFYCKLIDCPYFEIVNNMNFYNIPEGYKRSFIFFDNFITNFKNLEGYAIVPIIIYITILLWAAIYNSIYFPERKIFKLFILPLKKLSALLLFYLSIILFTTLCIVLPINYLTNQTLFYRNIYNKKIYDTVSGNVEVIEQNPYGRRTIIRINKTIFSYSKFGGDHITYHNSIVNEDMLKNNANVIINYYNSKIIEIFVKQ